MAQQEHESIKSNKEKNTEKKIKGEKNKINILFLYVIKYNYLSKNNFHMLSCFSSICKSEMYKDKIKKLQSRFGTIML